jgi:hypothetical protein
MPSTGSLAKKSRHKTWKNKRPSAKRNGPTALKGSTAEDRRQQEKPAGHGKAGSRRNKNRRAAMMIDAAGNLFLDP